MMIRNLTAILLTVLIMSAPATANQWGKGRCEATVSNTLRVAGIGPGDISDIAYVPNMSGGDDERVEGYSAWVRVKSCKSGYVVVDFDRQCLVSQIYAHGDCRVPGIK